MHDMGRSTEKLFSESLRAMSWRHLTISLIRIQVLSNGYGPTRSSFIQINIFIRSILSYTLYPHPRDLHCKQSSL